MEVRPGGRARFLFFTAAGGFPRRQFAAAAISVNGAGRDALSAGLMNRARRIFADARREIG